MVENLEIFKQTKNNGFLGVVRTFSYDLKYINTNKGTNKNAMTKN